MEDQSEHNPALADLEFLSGEWDMELSNAPFLPSRDDTVHGHVTVEWIEDGALLVMRQSEQSGNPPLARWAIGRDESVPDYRGPLLRLTRRVARLRDELLRRALEAVAQQPRLFAALRSQGEPGPEHHYLALGEDR